MGRPKKTFSEKERKEIANLVLGGMSMRAMAKHYKVALQTINNWLHIDADMEQRVENARKSYARIVHEDALAMALDDSKDVLTDPETGKIVLNSTRVARHKLGVGQMNRTAAILDSETFSEKHKVDLNTNNYYQGIVIEPPDPEEKDGGDDD